MLPDLVPDIEVCRPMACDDEVGASLANDMPLTSADSNGVAFLRMVTPPTPIFWLPTQGCIHDQRFTTG